MKFPTYKELGEIAAKEALDTFEYKGKTLREWIEIISAAELGTNLAEVGTDIISRQAVTKFLNDWLSCLFENCHKQSASDLKMIIKDFKNLPSAQPEPESISKWKKEFREYVGSLDISRDDWKGIIEYIDEMPSTRPFYNITLTDVLKYIDDMPEDVWQEFTCCLECRGWRLQWCGGDFS